MKSFISNRNLPSDLIKDDKGGLDKKKITEHVNLVRGRRKMRLIS